MRQRQIAARSLSRQVQEWLARGPTTARVFAVFEQACNLVTSDDEVIALVAPQIGDGPLNVVLDRSQSFFGCVQPGIEVVCDADRLLLSNGKVGSHFQIDLRGAVLSEPCPDWDSLRARRDQMLPALETLRVLCLGHGSDSAFFPLLGVELSADALYRRRAAGLERAQQAAIDLRAGWGGARWEDWGSLRRGGAALAGLGCGLTPAGDDFLIGVMLWAWLAHPAPRPFCQILAEEAAPRTTTLSAALLRAASRGQCSAAWQRLLRALSEGIASDVMSAGRGILDFGATSGADALIGFLHMSCSTDVFCPR